MNQWNVGVFSPIVACLLNAILLLLLALSFKASEVNQVNHNTQKMGPTTLAHNEDDQFEVRCPCGCNEVTGSRSYIYVYTSSSSLPPHTHTHTTQDDGLMVLCGVCKTWQHAVCFALLHEDQVPELHVCDQCAQVMTTLPPPPPPYHFFTV